MENNTAVSSPPVENTVIKEERNPIAQEVLYDIVKAGIMAPSGDNVQPWQFAVGKDCITLYIKRDADDSFFNVRQVASLIACGAAIQNMVYMAEVKGLESQTVLFPSGEGTDEVARIYLKSSGQPRNETIEEAVYNRSTNRRMYATRQIDRDVWSEMQLTTHKEADILLLYNAEKRWRKPLAYAVYLADMVRCGRRDLHEYLMKIIQFKPVPKNIGEEDVPEEFRTGMPLKNLQAGLMGDIYMRSMRKWSVMRVARYFGAGLAMPIFGAMSVIQSGGIGMVCVKSFSEINIVRAGCAVERIWCELERKGYAFQPMAALPLLTLRTHLEGNGSFTASHIKKLEKAKAIACKQLDIPEGYIPVFMFRTGNSAKITQRTYRQRVEQLLRS